MNDAELQAMYTRYASKWAKISLEKQMHIAKKYVIEHTHHVLGVSVEVLSHCNQTTHTSRGTRSIEANYMMMGNKVRRTCP